jgi:hypothetical protein
LWSFAGFFEAEFAADFDDGEDVPYTKVPPKATPKAAPKEEDFDDFADAPVAKKAVEKGTAKAHASKAAPKDLGVDVEDDDLEAELRNLGVE